jgi:hypothetical protein
MRKKYYVTFGKLNRVLMADNEYQACMRVLRQHFKDLDKNEEDNDEVEENAWVSENECTTSIPSVFIVSQKGHEAHKDDLVVGVNLILTLLGLSSGVLTDEDINTSVSAD